MATSDVVVDIIGRREFTELLERQPQIAERLRQAMVEHLAADEAALGRPTSEDPAGP